MIRSAVKFLLICAAGVLIPASVHAQTAITAVPIVINTPGSYVLNNDLSFSSTSGAAITVQADNVTIDLQGFRLSGAPAGASTTAHAVYMKNRANLTIRNGLVEGFYRALYLVGDPPGANGFSASRAVVEGVRFTATASNAIYLNQVGASRIERCTFGLFSQRPAVALEVANAAELLVRDNYFSVSTPNNPDSNFYSSIAVRTASSSAAAGYGNIFIVDNQIDNCGSGIVANATTKYQKNITSNVTTPYTGGIDAGGNH